MLASAAGCDPQTSGGSGEVDVPDVYAFESRFDPEASSVSYSGQTFRQVLIASIEAELSKVQDELDAGAVFEAGEVAARLSFYYRFESETGGSLPHLLTTSPPPRQTTWDDISTDKDLQGKIAGNDPEGQHADWSRDLLGWSSAGSPDALVLRWFDEVDALAVAYAAQLPVDPQGVQYQVFYVSPQGVHYGELMVKFLLGAVNYSQGTDDYLDDDADGHGLLSDNTMPEEGEPFTALEHAWDEGFGYWGGARDYLAYTDDELAGEGGRPDYAAGWHDTDGDGTIDLTREINFGASVNAAKRDRGSVVPTDLSDQTMRAFLHGRAIIAAVDGDLSPEQLAALQQQRDAAVLGWEQSLAATAVHYINDVLQDMAAADYDFTGHAGHWSELKGFLLSLQFNPRARLSRDDLTRLHALVGEAPVAPGSAEADAYRADLLSARALLGTAYGFDPANLGDDAGQGGW
ncbi:MAG: DUF4856 domain-containing protein [Myxococcales bacterium]|nr:DUF4856 domain-containing protein [Myxococcales bacterium]